MMGNLKTLGEVIFSNLLSLIRQRFESSPPPGVSISFELFCVGSSICLRNNGNVSVRPSLHFQLSGRTTDTNMSSASVPAGCLEAIAASASPRHLREVLKALLVDLPARGCQVRRVRKAVERPKSSNRAKPRAEGKHPSTEKTCEPHLVFWAT